MNTTRIVATVCALCVSLALGCNTSDPTSAVLSNDYPNASDSSPADSVVVYKGWWAVAQFPDPVAPGQVSDPVRVVQGADYGYALLAPGWDPASWTAPERLIPIRSAQKLSVARGDTLNFAISDATTLGNCAGGKPLDQQDSDFITQRIFPQEFAGLDYDASQCTVVPTAEGAGGAGGTPVTAGGAPGQAGSP